MNLHRIERLINQAISTFQLDLSGLTILTEAASGYYVLTPLIAALAGAKNVLSLTRDSKYGKSADIHQETMALARHWKVDDKIQVLYDRSDIRIEEADIVTNLGFVRPLDANFLNGLKKTAVITLMWEPWEFRHEDMDIEKCRQLGIAVLGTNEHHPDLRIFEYIGYIALKLLFEVGIEIFNSKIVVLGQGEFADQIVQILISAKAEPLPISIDPPNDIKKGESINFFKQADAIVIAEHHHRKQLVGEKGLITARELYELNRGVTVIHICGNVDQKDINKVGIKCWPTHFASAGYMSAATDYVGPKPLIRLHTAGLKVGQDLAHARKEGASAFDSEINVLANLDLALGFEGYHYH